MIEKPKRPKQPDIQERQPPRTLQELVSRYDLDNTKIYDYLDGLADNAEQSLDDMQTIINNLSRNIIDLNTSVINLQNQINNKNMITVRPSANMTLTTASTEYKVSLNTVDSSVGTKLTLSSDNSVVIGSGITKVRINANVYWFTGANGYRGTISIKKNNTQIARDLQKINDNYVMTKIDTGLITVQEGDKITMHLTSSGANTIVANGASKETCMTVEAIF